MYQIPKRSERMFRHQDLVVWHDRSENRSLPIAAVVVHQQENTVIIRARVAGNVRELAVSTDELVER